MSKKNNKRSGFFAGHEPSIVGHGGAGGVAPANTLISIEKGIEEGAHIIEVDVTLTADGRVVGMHDWFVRHIARRRRQTHKHSLSEIKALDAGYWFTPDNGKTYPYRGMGIQYSTFDEILEVIGDFPLIVDCKLPTTVLVERAARLLRERSRLDERVLFSMPRAVAGSSRHLARPALTNFSAWEVQKLLAYSFVGAEKLFPLNGECFQVPLIGRRFSHFAQRYVETVHKLGLEINAWTIDEVEEMERVLDLGVDAITTNYPSRLKALIEQRKREQDSR